MNPTSSLFHKSEKEMTAGEERRGERGKKNRIFDWLNPSREEEKRRFSHLNSLYGMRSKARRVKEKKSVT